MRVLRSCITLVGDITRDSRALRFAEALSVRGPVSVVTLHTEARRFAIAGADVDQRAQAHPGSLRRSLPAFWRGDAPTGGASVDLVLASDLYALPLAARIARAHDAVLLYDSRELYSDVAALVGRPLAQHFWRAVERRYATRAAAMLTVNESIRDILSARYPRQRHAVLRNLPRRVEVAGHTAADVRSMLGIPRDEVLLLSQGGVQQGRGAQPLIAALAHVQGCRVLFLGDGPLARDIPSIARRAGVEDRVHHLPAVPSAVLASYTAGADIGCCLIEDLGRSYRLSLPNKLFEYIAAGLPVLGSELPEISAIVRGHGLGLTADPADPRAVSDAMRRLVHDGALRASCSARALTAAPAFVWEKEVEVLHRLIDAVVPARRT